MLIVHRRVRAYWPIDEEGDKFVKYEELVSNPELVAKVEARLRKRLLSVLIDAESLDLPLRDPWWAALTEATRTART